MTGLPDTSGRIIVITGCSGGGKSTLCAALSKQGWPIAKEAGRQIIQQQFAQGGNALPWTDAAAFISLAARLHVEQVEEMLAQRPAQPLLTDRSLIDLAAFAELNDVPLCQRMDDMIARLPYAPRIFYVPPWEQIYRTDDERPKSFPAAVREHKAGLAAYLRRGYQLIEIPRAPVAERAHFVTSALAEK